MDRRPRAGRVAFRAAALPDRKRACRNRRESRRRQARRIFRSRDRPSGKQRTRRSSRVGDDVEKLRFNRCVAHIYEAANTIGTAIDANKTPSPDLAWAFREAAEILMRISAPMMPHLAEECWSTLGHKKLIAEEPWPEVEKALLVEDTITLPVQINGKKRGDVTVPRDAAASEVEKAVLALDAVQQALGGKAPEADRRGAAENRECRCISQ